MLTKLKKDALDFLSNKFGGFERNRLEKKKIIKDLKEEVTYLRRKVNNITAETDRQDKGSTL